MSLAAPQASVPGIIGSVAGVITAITVLIGALVGGFKVVVPLLRETRELRKETAGNTAQLHVIHTLVNSTLTAALQAELDSTRREALLLQELIGMRHEDGREPTEDQRAALGATQRRIGELRQAMDDRREQTRSADLQIEKEIRRGG